MQNATALAEIEAFLRLNSLASPCKWHPAYATCAQTAVLSASEPRLVSEMVGKVVCAVCEQIKADWVTIACDLSEHVVANKSIPHEFHRVFFKGDELASFIQLRGTYTLHALCTLAEAGFKEADCATKLLKTATSEQLERIYVCSSTDTNLYAKALATPCVLSVMQRVTGYRLHTTSHMLNCRMLHT